MDREIMDCDFCDNQQVIDVNNEDNTWWMVGRPSFGDVEFYACPNCFKKKVKTLLRKLTSNDK